MRVVFGRHLLKVVALLLMSGIILAQFLQRHAGNSLRLWCLVKRIIPLARHFVLACFNFDLIGWSAVPKPVKQPLDLFPYCLLLLNLLFLHNFPPLFLDIQLQPAFISYSILVETFKLFKHTPSNSVFQGLWIESFDVSDHWPESRLRFLLREWESFQVHQNLFILQIEQILYKWLRISFITFYWSKDGKADAD